MERRRCWCCEAIELLTSTRQIDATALRPTSRVIGDNHLTLARSDHETIQSPGL